MIRHQQPFTVVTPVNTLRGREYQITGFVYEEKFKKDEWVGTWERIDLGHRAWLADAYKEADSWRANLVGQFAIGN